MAPRCGGNEQSRRLNQVHLPPPSWLDNRFPALGEVVLIAQFDGGPGLAWPSGDNGDLSNNEVYVQDWYQGGGLSGPSRKVKYIPPRCDDRPIER